MLHEHVYVYISIFIMWVYNIPPFQKIYVHYCLWVKIWKYLRQISKEIMRQVNQEIKEMYICVI